MQLAANVRLILARDRRRGHGHPFINRWDRRRHPFQDAGADGFPKIEENVDQNVGGEGTSVNTLEGFPYIILCTFASSRARTALLSLSPPKFRFYYVNPMLRLCGAPFNLSVINGHLLNSPTLSSAGNAARAVLFLRPQRFVAGKPCAHVCRDAPTIPCADILLVRRHAVQKELFTARHLLRKTDSPPFVCPGMGPLWTREARPVPKGP